MKVLKRSGSCEDMKFDKVTSRISKLAQDLLDDVSPDRVAQKVVESMYDGISTQEIDSLAAEVSIGWMTQQPKYETLATRIIASNIQKIAPKTFTEAMTKEATAGLLSESINYNDLDDVIVPERDFAYGYFGLKTLEKSYLQKVNGVIVETPQYLFLRVALGIHGDDRERVIDTYKHMSKGYFIHATPTLFNAGTPRPQMSSCFLLAMKDDSIDGIYGTLTNCAHISKWAGGIGLHIHNIRANKSKIRGTNGISDGIIPMLRVYNSTARYVNQAGRRKGSIAVYLEPWHADIMEFLELRLNQGDEEARCRDLFSAMWIPDLFMKRVEEGGDWSLFCPDKCPGLSDCYGDEFEKLYTQYESEGRANFTIPAMQVWKAIIKSQTETGTPYMLYKDSCNRKSNQKNIGVIKSSNLCVAPDTKILTTNGYISISELENQEVDVWNGLEFSRTRVVKTGEEQELVRVHTTSGGYIDCTPYHKFYIETGSRPAQKSRVRVVEAQDLCEGMKLIQHELPIIPGEGVVKYAYTHGLFCADGTRAKKKSFLDLYHKKKELLNHCSYEYANDCPKENRIRLKLPDDIPEKYLVPINKSLKTRLEWLAGYVDGDGCIVTHNGIKNIQYTSIHKQFLLDIQLMLQGMGINVVVRLAQPKRNTTIKGETWECQELWRSSIDSEGLRLLSEIGFAPRRLDITNCRERHHKTNQYIKIESVEWHGRVDDTYCFNEPKRHMGLFNGIITGQCTEILEVSKPNETAVCNLGSLALPKFIEGDEFDFEMLEKVTRILTRNLNRVIDRNYYPIEEAKNSNMRHRPIGIGVQGLADVFAIMKMPFESPEARKLNKDIFETIYYAALEESCQLAIEDGPYETFDGSPASRGILQFDMWDEGPNASGVVPVTLDWTTLKERIKKHGLRNSLLLAPMPTASTSQILGNNECIEPYTTNIYLRRTLAGEFVVINKYLVNALIEKGLWSSELKNKMIKAGGSIKDIPEIPQDIKDLFKTVWEIKQKAIIDMAADRGRFIDQSQSMNLFVENPTMSKLSSMHMYAWKSGLKTGMYYLRSKAKARPIQFTIDPSTVCETCSA